VARGTGRGGDWDGAARDHRGEGQDDRRDARTLARLPAAGTLHGCRLADEQTRALRPRLARRAQLVRQRTRAKNEIHAVLMRTLNGRPPMSDAFGRRGRLWLAGLKLPGDERNR
jgi:transposase